jgi:small subunit ribosomal protein S29
MPPRLRLRPFILPHRGASFSTSCPFRFPMPAKKKSPSIQTGPARKTLRLTKKNYIKDPKPPAPGERKAFRKRLVLSNTNAVDVPLTDVSRENMLNSDLSGTVVGIPGEIVDALRISGAFKVTQGWSNYKRPAFLMRRETQDLAIAMKEIDSAQIQPLASDSPRSKTICKIVHGERKTGKSTFLMQAMAMAFLRDWVVVSIPECEYAVIFMRSC